MCTAIVLLIKPFIWERSRCRYRRGLLNFPVTRAGRRTRPCGGERERERRVKRVEPVGER